MLLLQTHFPREPHLVELQPAGWYGLFAVFLFDGIALVALFLPDVAFIPPPFATVLIGLESFNITSVRVHCSLKPVPLNVLLQTHFLREPHVVLGFLVGELQPAGW